MRRWYITLAVAGLAGLYACSDSPLETDCCRLLTSIEVTPSTATVPAGASQQFTATIRDDNGEEVETDIGWSVTSSARGSVTPDGTFNAASAGQVYVRAVVGVLRDSALVTVTAQ